MSLLDTIIEFTEIYIHSILYYEKCYPREWFVDNKRFNSGYICNNVDVNNYIKSICHKIRSLINTGLLKVITVVIFDDLLFNDKVKPLKRFNLEFGNTRNIHNIHTDKSISRDIDNQLVVAIKNLEFHTVGESKSFYIDITMKRTEIPDILICPDDQCLIDINHDPFLDFHISIFEYHEK